MSSDLYITLGLNKRMEIFSDRSYRKLYMADTALRHSIGQWPLRFRMIKSRFTYDIAENTLVRYLVRRLPSAKITIDDIGEHLLIRDPLDWYDLTDNPNMISDYYIWGDPDGKAYMGSKDQFEQRSAFAEFVLAKRSPYMYEFIWGDYESPESHVALKEILDRLPQTKIDRSTKFPMLVIANDTDAVFLKMLLY